MEHYYRNFEIIFGTSTETSLNEWDGTWAAQRYEAERAKKSRLWLSRGLIHVAASKYYARRFSKTVPNFPKMSTKFFWKSSKFSAIITFLIRNIRYKSINEITDSANCSNFNVYVNRKRNYTLKIQNSR